LLRVNKYVLETENYCLKMKPSLKYNGLYLKGVSDSEYAGDKDKRNSVYGNIPYFCGAPISWKSKSRKSVTLSSTEAEYFTMTEIAKEVFADRYLLEYIGVKLQYPIEIHCDIVSAFYLGNNHKNSHRTKHIDTEQHFVQEFVEDDILKIVFTKSGNNRSDIFTKNPTEEVLTKHSKEIVSEKYDSNEAGDKIN
jgi:hypothetical protein